MLLIGITVLFEGSNVKCCDVNINVCLHALYIYIYTKSTKCTNVGNHSKVKLILKDYA